MMSVSHVTCVIIMSHVTRNIIVLTQKPERRESRQLQAVCDMCYRYIHVTCAASM